ncbi:response regulator transcription factor [Paenibacillus graminis]|uniref:response regulator transcription factor n=1 Tax=Paenibacillus graminis TaxID=189425 RepID=UPI002DBD4C2C|nr:response regulator [Paenibacillus graminis]MEC0168560.1 response regulator [Paenibacillus graminis]
MFKVLLVDDEVYVRKGLLELIQWESLKFSIVGEANNGAEALDMMEQLEPDLVITDIRMPILDGLDLIRSVNEHAGLDSIFIIISGFHDFKYAQQALRYGVHDYILKPIDEEEMTATLRKLSYAMGRKRIATLTNDDLTTSAIMEALVQENLQAEDAEPYAAALGLEGESGFLYAVTEIHAGQQDKQTTVKQFQEALHSLEEGGAGIPVLEQQPGTFGMLLCTGRITGGHGGLALHLERLRAVLSERLNTGLSLYAGDPVDSLVHVHRSYSEANEAARHKYAENTGVIMYSCVTDKPLYVFDMSPVLASKLIMQIEEGNKKDYQQTVNSMFRLFHEQRFTPQAVTGSLSRCMTGILGVIKEMDGNEEEILRLKDLAERGHGQWSLQMLQEHFMQAVQEAAEYIARLRKAQCLGGIKPVKRYIDTHYRENISLKSIAAEFYMNAVYLGRLFRKTYGVYFNDYLLELRIQEAKKLLRQSDLRMYEIAGRVGFQNADYFVTQFEKLEQISPSEYRNMLIHKE